ncbi:hypothetical protein HK101_000570 [Irineochytrium annulatum]|nr:hypothetical protein HK101_000570 [Irineochytrium annulatum]
MNLARVLSRYEEAWRANLSPEQSSLAHVAQMSYKSVRHFVCIVDREVPYISDGVKRISMSEFKENGFATILK